MPSPSTPHPISDGPLVSQQLHQPTPLMQAPPAPFQQQAQGYNDGQSFEQEYLDTESPEAMAMGELMSMALDVCDDDVTRADGR